MTRFTIKKDATFPRLALRLKTKPTLASPDGITATLTGATVQFFRWDRATKTIKVNAGAMTILAATPPSDENEPNVEYPWVVADTNTRKIYEYHVKVEYTGGGIEYFPDDEYGVVEIGDSPT